MRRTGARVDPIFTARRTARVLLTGLAVAVAGVAGATDVAAQRTG